MSLREGIFSDRDYPFGTILFLVTAPLNAIFIIGMLLAQEPFNYNYLINLIPIEFVIFNFAITSCGLFLIYGGNEWCDGCF